MQMGSRAGCGLSRGLATNVEAVLQEASLVPCGFGGRCLLSPPRGIRGERVTPSGSGNFQKVEPPFHQPYVLPPFGKERVSQPLFSLSWDSRRVPGWTSIPRNQGSCPQNTARQGGSSPVLSETLVPDLGVVLKSGSPDSTGRGHKTRSLYGGTAHVSMWNFKPRPAQPVYS